MIGYLATGIAFGLGYAVSHFWKSDADQRYGWKVQASAVAIPSYGVLDALAQQKGRRVLFGITQTLDTDGTPTVAGVRGVTLGIAHVTGGQRYIRVRSVAYELVGGELPYSLPPLGLEWDLRDNEFVSVDAA